MLLALPGFNGKKCDVLLLILIIITVVAIFSAIVVNSQPTTAAVPATTKYVPYHHEHASNCTTCSCANNIGGTSGTYTSCTTSSSTYGPFTCYLTSPLLVFRAHGYCPLQPQPGYGRVYKVLPRESRGASALVYDPILDTVLVTTAIQGKLFSWNPTTLAGEWLAGTGIKEDYSNNTADGKAAGIYRAQGITLLVGNGTVPSFTGWWIVSLHYNNCIKRISRDAPHGVSTVAGVCVASSTAPVFADGTGAGATFYRPFGMDYHRAAKMHVLADLANRVVRKMVWNQDAEALEVSVLAGIVGRTVKTDNRKDGAATTEAIFYNPGFATLYPGKTSEKLPVALFIVDYGPGSTAGSYRPRVRRLTPVNPTTGVVSTIRDAGPPSAPLYHGRPVAIMEHLQGDGTATMVWWNPTQGVNFFELTPESAASSAGIPAKIKASSLHCGDRLTAEVMFLPNGTLIYTLRSPTDLPSDGDIYVPSEAKCWFAGYTTMPTTAGTTTKDAAGEDSTTTTTPPTTSSASSSSPSSTVAASTTNSPSSMPSSSSGFTTTSAAAESTTTNTASSPPATSPPSPTPTTTTTETTADDDVKTATTITSDSTTADTLSPTTTSITTSTAVPSSTQLSTKTTNATTTTTTTTTTPPPFRRKDQEPVSVVSKGVATMAGLAAGASASTYVRLSRKNLDAGRIAQCGASTEIEPLDFSSNPLFISIGGDDSPWATYRGAILGNLALSALWLLGGYVLGHARRRVKNIDSLDKALAQVHFPGMVAVPLSLWGPPAAAAVVVMIGGIVRSDGLDMKNDIVIIAVGLAWSVFVPTVGLALVGRLIDLYERLETDAEMEERAAAQKRLDGKEKAAVPLLTRFFRYIGLQQRCWIDSDRVSRLSQFFDSFSNPHYTAIDFTAATAIAMASGVADVCRSRACCITSAVLSLLSALAHTAFTFGMFPFLIRGEALLIPAMSVTAFVTSVLVLVAVVISDYEEEASSMVAKSTTKGDEDTFDMVVKIMDIVNIVAFVIGFIGMVFSILINAAIPMAYTLRKSFCPTPEQIKEMRRKQRRLESGGGGSSSSASSSSSDSEGTPHDVVEKTKNDRSNNNTRTPSIRTAGQQQQQQQQQQQHHRLQEFQQSLLMGGDDGGAGGGRRKSSRNNSSVGRRGQHQRELHRNDDRDYEDDDDNDGVELLPKQQHLLQAPADSRTTKREEVKKKKKEKHPAHHAEGTRAAVAVKNSNEEEHAAAAIAEEARREFRRGDVATPASIEAQISSLWTPKTKKATQQEQQGKEQ